MLESESFPFWVVAYLGAAFFLGALVELSRKQCHFVDTGFKYSLDALLFLVPLGIIVVIFDISICPLFC